MMQKFEKRLDFKGPYPGERAVLDLEVRLMMQSDGEDFERKGSVFLSFLEEEIKSMTYGVFLSEYGATLLKSIPDELKIPLYTTGTSFPMQLSFESMMGDKVFDNDNRDAILPWNKDEPSVLILERIPDADVGEFTACVISKEDAFSTCIVCHGELSDPVNSSVSNDHSLPRLGRNDITELACTHRFHTHCILKACSHQYYKCTRCTVDPGKTWWNGYFQSVWPDIKTCQWNCEHDFKLNMLLRTTQDFCSEIEKQMMKLVGKEFTGPQMDRKAAMSSLQQKLTEKNEEIAQIRIDISHKKAIQAIIDEEYKFLSEKIRQPLQSHFQPKIQNLDGLHRINTLLERFLAQ